MPALLQRLDDPARHVVLVVFGEHRRGSKSTVSAQLSLGDRVTLVNFFASWCVPCREEHAQLMALAHRPGVTLEGVAYKDKPEDARRFLDGLGNPYRRIGVDRNGSTAIDFGVYGVPETYVVDGSGHIRFRQVGPLTAEDVEHKILPLIDRITASAGQPG